MLNSVDDITALQQSSLRRHASDMSWDYEKCESLCKDIVSQCSSILKWCISLRPILLTLTLYNYFLFYFSDFIVLALLPSFFLCSPMGNLPRAIIISLLRMKLCTFFTHVNNNILVQSYCNNLCQVFGDWFKEVSSVIVCLSLLDFSSLLRGISGTLF